MKPRRILVFSLATASALAGSCSLNPQPFPPMRSSQTTNGNDNPVGGVSDASLASLDATPDAATGEQFSPTVSRDAGDTGSQGDAAVDTQIEAEMSDDSASDVTIEAGE